jgi:dolichol-phosphate mannosyltransferase
MYNEAGNVIPLLNEIYSALNTHPQFEIIVVDDGSKDGTSTELQQAKQQIPVLRVIKHGSNRGQSVGVVSGVRAAKFPWVITLDGDGQNNPQDILALAKVAEENLNKTQHLLIAGHRTDRKDTGWKKFGSRFANTIRQKLLNDNCPDSGCGVKLFLRDDFLLIPHFNHLHRFLPALFKRAGATIINVPVGHRQRVRGQSKYGNWGRLKVGIIDLFGVAWLIRRPCLSERENEV